ncbi:unnamed protein product [Vitrella brassicaformis CCMP3155]|uniref:TNFR-Cys domain-containing protein n=2 Tax=Vitrella brassicaformis TaxID=1169539 RepID=A0A0G4G7S1_VITBC|nr:unnamed protein product [Vitrella brassicaformis CCMP3155]|eukprot:CEM24755.1 unnamed protein product [Vitrella brassicaformis CCMP3155]
MFAALSVASVIVGCAVGAPSLSHLYVIHRSGAGDTPVDIQPAFTPSRHEYEARLSWREDTFTVMAEVTDATHDEIGEVYICTDKGDCSRKKQTIALMDREREWPIKEGGLVRFGVQVRQKNGKDQTEYSVLISRAPGNIVQLTSIDVDGPSLQPPFRADQSDYILHLSVSEEEAVLHCQPADIGQLVYATAGAVNGLSTEESSKLSEPRMLTDALSMYPVKSDIMAGESNHAGVVFRFPVPMKSKRGIDIRVTSADGASHGYYNIEASRPGCIAGMYFDDTQSKCVQYCSNGFFPDEGTCKACPRFCARCTSMARCISCKGNSKSLTYRLHNGQCDEASKPFFTRYTNVFLGSVLALSLAALSILGISAAFFCIRRKRHADDELQTLTESTR